MDREDFLYNLFKERGDVKVSQKKGRRFQPHLNLLRNFIDMKICIYIHSHYTYHDMISCATLPGYQWLVSVIAQTTWYTSGNDW